MVPRLLFESRFVNRAPSHQRGCVTYLTAGNHVTGLMSAAPPVCLCRCFLLGGAKVCAPPSTTPKTTARPFLTFGLVRLDAPLGVGFPLCAVQSEAALDSGGGVADLLCVQHVFNGVTVALR